MKKILFLFSMIFFYCNIVQAQTTATGHIFCEVIDGDMLIVSKDSNIIITSKANKSSVISISGQPNYLYTIILPQEVMATEINGTESIWVKNIIYNSKRNNTLGSDGKGLIKVTGDTKEAKESGFYQSHFEITVSYN